MSYETMQVLVTLSMLASFGALVIGYWNKKVIEELVAINKGVTDKMVVVVPQIEPEKKAIIPVPKGKRRKY